MSRRRSLLTLPSFALAGLLALCAVPLGAQLVLAKPGETLPTFEVATIKPNTSESGNMRMSTSATGYSVENLPLREIVKHAWGAKADAQITGGPEALLGEHFDIDAKIDPDDVARMKNMSREDRGRIFDLMLQALLTDRFRIQVHIDSRELPIYALIVAKGGPKLTAAAPPPPAPDPAASTPSPQPPGPGHRGTMMRMSSNSAEITTDSTRMAGLASMLSGFSETGERLVIDKTGLTGSYTFTLRWAPENMAAGAAASTEPGPDSPPLLTALQEQLGLKLEPDKAPVQIVVIDHAEPPTPN